MKRVLYYLLFFIFVVLCSCTDETDDAIGGESYSTSLGLFDGSAEGASSFPISENGDSTQQYEPGVITAGEWNDLENWDFWYKLMEEDTFGFASKYWEIYPIRNRYSLLVKNRSGQPVVDLLVTLRYGKANVWQARTDNKGKAEFWTDPYSGIKNQSISNLKFYIDGKLVNQVVIPFDQGINTITYDKTTRPSALDVVFVVDATGSMGDELEYLKTEVLDVINDVKTSNSQLDVKMGSVFYRDEGDAYITRVSQITNNIQSTVDFIKAQSADGGGDYPEAVHSAVKDAVEQLSWSPDAVARIMFLVLDAPPHYHPSVINSIQEDIKHAAEKGIKIIPVSASGIDKGTEFLLRFMSVLSNGTYVFITDHSGIGNEHLTPTIGEYEVEYLNELMVRLINEYVE